MKDLSCNDSSNASVTSCKAAKLWWHATGIAVLTRKAGVLCNFSVKLPSYFYSENISSDFKDISRSKIY